MIAFSISDYITFSISALVYGLVFSLFECFVFCLWGLSGHIASGLISSLFYKGSPFSYTVGEYESKKQKSPGGELLAALRALGFCLGFIIISFAFMDGQIRLFGLCLALLGYIPFSKYVSPCIKRAVFYLGAGIVKFFVIVIRLLTYIPRRVILAFLALFDLFCKHFKQNDRRCKLIAIDKSDKK